MTPAMVRLVAAAALPDARAAPRRGLPGRASPGRSAARWSRWSALVVEPAALAHAAAGAGGAAADLGLAHLSRDALRRAGRARQPRRAPRADARAHRWPLLGMGVRRRLPRRGAVAALGDERADAGLRADADPGLDLALHAGVRVLGALVRALPARRAARPARCARPRSPSPPAPAEPLRLPPAAPAGRPSPHELRPHHHRRRDPVGQARRQAPAQGDRAARGARPLAVLGALRRRRPRAHHRRPEATRSPAATPCSPAAASAPRPTTTRASARPRRSACRWRCIPRRAS